MNVFKRGAFTIKRISTRGAWLVSCKDAVDLGLLFLRPQEFAECSNPKFRGQPFSLTDFIRWYVKRNQKKTKSGGFDYFEYFEGFNISGDQIGRFLSACPPESNLDWTFRGIVAGIKRIDPKFYLIGALNKSVAVLDHEIAHAMFALDTEYRGDALRLVNKLHADDFALARKALVGEGYVDDTEVIHDEINAYMSTGLLDVMGALEQKRVPFMQLFSEHKAKFLDL